MNKKYQKKKEIKKQKWWMKNVIEIKKTKSWLAKKKCMTCWWKKTKAMEKNDWN